MVELRLTKRTITSTHSSAGGEYKGDLTADDDDDEEEEEAEEEETLLAHDGYSEQEVKPIAFCSPDHSLLKNKLELAKVGWDQKIENSHSKQVIPTGELGVNCANCLSAPCQEASLLSPITSAFQIKVSRGEKNLERPVDYLYYAHQASLDCKSISIQTQTTSTTRDLSSQPCCYSERPRPTADNLIQKQVASQVRKWLMVAEDKGKQKVPAEVECQFCLPSQNNYPSSPAGLRLDGSSCCCLTAELKQQQQQHNRPQVLEDKGSDMYKSLDCSMEKERKIKIASEMVVGGRKALATTAPDVIRSSWWHRKWMRRLAGLKLGASIVILLLILQRLNFTHRLHIDSVVSVKRLDGKGNSIGRGYLASANVFPARETSPDDDDDDNNNNTSVASTSTIDWPYGVGARFEDPKKNIRPAAAAAARRRSRGQDRSLSFHHVPVEWYEEKRILGLTLTIMKPLPDNGLRRWYITILGLENESGLEINLDDRWKNWKGRGRKFKVKYERLLAGSTIARAPGTSHLDDQSQYLENPLEGTFHELQGANELEKSSFFKRAPIEEKSLLSCLSCWNIVIERVVNSFRLPSFAILASACTLASPTSEPANRPPQLSWMRANLATDHPLEHGASRGRVAPTIPSSTEKRLAGYGGAPGGGEAQPLEPLVRNTRETYVKAASRHLIGSSNAWSRLFGLTAWDTPGSSSTLEVVTGDPEGDHESNGHSEAQRGSSSSTTNPLPTETNIDANYNNQPHDGSPTNSDLRSPVSQDDLHSPTDQTTSSSSSSSSFSTTIPSNNSSIQQDYYSDNPMVGLDSNQSLASTIAVGVGVGEEGRSMVPKNPDLSFQFDCELDFDTYNQRSTPSWPVKIVFIANYALIFSFGTVGNTLTLLAMFRKRERFSVIDIFIANLALSDIMFCLFDVTITPIYLLLHRYWILGLTLCKLFAFTQCASVYVSTFTMINIAYVRYKLIVHPHAPSMTKCIASILNLTTWLAACLISLPYLLHIDLKPDGCPGHVFCDEDWAGDDQVYFSWLTLAFQFLLPCACTSFLYQSVYWKLRKQRLLRRTQQLAQEERQLKQLQQQLRSGSLINGTSASICSVDTAYNTSASTSTSAAAGGAFTKSSAKSIHKRLRYRERLFKHFRHSSRNQGHSDSANCSDGRLDYASDLIQATGPLVARDPVSQGPIEGPGSGRSQSVMVMRIRRQSLHDEKLIAGASGSKCETSNTEGSPRAASQGKPSKVAEAPNLICPAQTITTSTSFMDKREAANSDLPSSLTLPDVRFVGARAASKSNENPSDERKQQTIYEQERLLGTDKKPRESSSLVLELDANAGSSNITGASSSLINCSRLSEANISGHQAADTKPQADLRGPEGSPDCGTRSDMSCSEAAIAMRPHTVGSIAGPSSFKSSPVNNNNKNAKHQGGLMRQYVHRHHLFHLNSANHHNHRHPHHHHNHHHHNHNNTPTLSDIFALREKRMREKDKRLSQTNRKLLFMVALFACSWLPLNTFNLIQEYWDGMVNWKYFKHFFFVAHIIASSSVCYNPLLYAWMSDNYRQELRQILPKCIVNKFSGFFNSNTNTDSNINNNANNLNFLVVAENNSNSNNIN